MRRYIAIGLLSAFFASENVTGTPELEQEPETMQFRYLNGFGTMTVIRPGMKSDSPAPLILGLWSETRGARCGFRAVEDVSKKRMEGSTQVVTVRPLLADNELSAEIIEVRFVGERNVYFDGPPAYFLCEPGGSFAGRWVRTKQ